MESSTSKRASVVVRWKRERTAERLVEYSRKRSSAVVIKGFGIRNGVAPTNGSDTSGPLELIPRDRSETTTTLLGSDDELAFFSRQSRQLIRQWAKVLGDSCVGSVSHDGEGISQCSNCANASGSAGTRRVGDPVQAQQAEPSEAPFADDLMGADTAIHGLERGDSTLAGAAAGGATSPRMGEHPGERCREHDFRGRAGGRGSVEETTRRATASTRVVENIGRRRSRSLGVGDPGQFAFSHCSGCEAKGLRDIVHFKIGINALLGRKAIRRRIHGSRDPEAANVGGSTHMVRVCNAGEGHAWRSAGSRLGLSDISSATCGRREALVLVNGARPQVQPGRGRWGGKFPSAPS